MISYATALIDDTTIHTASGPHHYTRAIGHVTDLAQGALRADLETLWIMPGTALATLAQTPGFWEERAGWHVFCLGEQGAYAEIRRDGDAHGEQRRAIFIHSAGGRWGQMLSGAPSDILLRLDRYTSLMGLPPHTSPGTTGLKLLQVLNDRQPTRAGWLRPITAEWITGAPWETPPQLAHVTRSPFVLRTTIHVYDKNAAHMAAAASRMFGSGDPVKDGTGALYSDKAYGFWLVTADADGSPYNGVTLPSPFYDAGQRVQNRWCYGPEVKLARRLGWRVTVNRGLVWPETHDLFSDWVHALWRARLTARAAGDVNTEDTIKASFNAAKGQFRSPPRDGAHAAWSHRVAWSHRQDWQGTIITEHNLRQIDQIKKFAQATDATGNYLAVLNGDTIVWASADPDPATAIPGILTRCDGLGGYKHVGTISGPAATDIQRLIVSGVEATDLDHAIKAARGAQS